MLVGLSRSEQVLPTYISVLETNLFSDQKNIQRTLLSNYLVEELSIERSKVKFPNYFMSEISYR